MKLYQNLNVTGSLTLTGSLNTVGTITATTLVVQTITSSVTAMTGSTKFGQLPTNTHQFTGSVLISGSNVLIGSAVSNGFRFKVSNNGAEEWALNPGDSSNLNNHVNYNRNTSAYIGANYLAATHSFLQGNVGIGTSSPQSILHSVRSNSVTASSGTTPSGYALSFGSVDGNNGGVWFSGDFGGDQGICGINGSRTSGYQTELAFYTNNTNSARAFSERMRITAAGNVGIGTANPVGPLMIAVPAVGSAIGASNAQTAYDYSRFRIKHYTDSNLGISIGYAGSNLTYIQTGYNEGSVAPLTINPYGGEVRVGTSGLKFSNGSTALNYYEEGTFTPTGINTNFSAVTPTWGRYVRIGNQVTINVRWDVTPNGTGTRWLVFNLPFAFNITTRISLLNFACNIRNVISLINNGFIAFFFSGRLSVIVNTCAFCSYKTCAKDWFCIDFTCCWV